MEFLAPGIDLERLRGIVEMIDDVIWSMDADTLRTIYMSPSAERLYGRPLADLLRSETWIEFVPPEDFTEILSLCAQVRAGDAASTVFRARHPSRGLRYVQMKAHPVFSGDRVTRIEGIATDITDRVNAEREMAEHQQKLVAASKMNTLGELASGIGHEINTPLTGIMSKIARLEMMIERGEMDRERALRFCRESNQLVGKISEIIQGLKDLSQERTSEGIASFDPVGPVNQALSLTRARFSNHGILIEVENLLPAGMQASGIPTYLFQALVNLLNNSFDALSQRDGGQLPCGGWVRVRMEKAGNELLVSVTDNGPGISPALAGRLFQPFQTTKKNQQGTGLGLSISRRLLRQMKGDLVLSAETAHTTFVIFLPLELAGNA